MQEILYKLKNVFSSSGSTLIALVISIILNKFAAINLSEESYALYGQFLLFSTFLMALFTSGLSNNLISSSISDHKTTVFYTSFGYISVLLVIIFSSKVEKFFSIQLSLPVYVVLLFLPIVYQLFISVQAVNAKQNNSRDYFLFSIANTVVGMFIVCLAISYESYLVLIVAVLIRPGALSFYLIFSGKVAMVRSGEPVKEEKGYPTPFYLYGFISLMSGIITTGLIRDSLNDSYGFSEMGQYFAAQRIFEIMLSLSAAFYSTFYFSNVSKMTFSDAKLYMYRVSITSCILFSLSSLLLNLFSSELVTLLLSEKQLGAISYFFPLSINLVLNSIGYCSGYLILSRISKYKVSLIETLFLIIFCSLSLFFTGTQLIWLMVLISASKVILNYIILHFVSDYE
ncbi:hypothetical protein [Endozoicomonas sp. ALD040]|uniref:hypothetical protein n=1 Tax=Endozoicomonas sp. ALD040 TaxID=3403079 RepID=UPI003BB15B4F